MLHLSRGMSPSAAFVIHMSSGCYLENFAWADQRVKVCCIFHKVLLRWEESFINCSTVLYGTSKLNKVQLCMKCILLPC